MPLFFTKLVCTAWRLGGAKRVAEQIAAFWMNEPPMGTKNERKGRAATHSPGWLGKRATWQLRSVEKGAAAKKWMEPILLGGLTRLQRVPECIGEHFPAKRTRKTITLKLACSYFRLSRTFRKTIMPSIMKGAWPFFRATTVLFLAACIVCGKRYRELGKESARHWMARLLHESSKL